MGKKIFLRIFSIDHASAGTKDTDNSHPERGEDALAAPPQDRRSSDMES
jgi:hypothetical protein